MTTMPCRLDIRKQVLEDVYNNFIKDRKIFKQVSLDTITIVYDHTSVHKMKHRAQAWATAHSLRDRIHTHYNNGVFVNIEESTNTIEGESDLTQPIVVYLGVTPNYINYLIEKSNIQVAPEVPKVTIPQKVSAVKNVSQIESAIKELQSQIPIGYYDIIEENGKYFVIDSSTLSSKEFTDLESAELYLQNLEIKTEELWYQIGQLENELATIHKQSLAGLSPQQLAMFKEFFNNNQNATEESALEYFLKCKL